MPALGLMSVHLMVEVVATKSRSNVLAHMVSKFLDNCETIEG